MRSLRDFLAVREDARDAATERLLRGQRAGLGDEELRASIAGAWRRIEQARFAPRPRRAATAGFALYRLLVPSLALVCLLCGLWIGQSLESPDLYGSALSGLARPPILAELDP